jgi:DNA-binding CsgD family transcriptional regulator
LAEAYGGTGVASRAREELTTAGGRLSRRPEEPALTQGERRVARLAAQGLSNDRIAQELFVSRRTVETHLTHAYAKLGIKSRAQLGDALAASEAGEGHEPANPAA